MGQSEFVQAASTAEAPGTGEPGTVRAAAYRIDFANTDSDVREAQRLRYRVFAEEMGAEIVSGETEIDRDPFDAYCEHLLVRQVPSRRVVGTYRLLTFDQATEAGGFYSANEFDLRRIVGLSTRMVELGRACVDPDHRNGVVISLLWTGLFDYICSRGYEYVLGCGSVGIADDGRSAMGICNRLRRERLSPVEWRVFPYCPFPLDTNVTDDHGTLPPLIKGYLRLGALICGDPAWDRQFRTADFLLLLPVADVNPRYATGLRRRAQRGRE